MQIEQASFRVTSKVVLTSPTDTLVTTYDYLLRKGAEVKISPEAGCVEGTLKGLRVSLFTSKELPEAVLSVQSLISDVGNACPAIRCALDYFTSLIKEIKPLSINSVTYVITHEFQIKCSDDVLSKVNESLTCLGAVPITKPAKYVGSGTSRYVVVSRRYLLVTRGLRKVDVLVTSTATESSCTLRITVSCGTSCSDELRSFAEDTVTAWLLVLDSIQDALRNEEDGLNEAALST